MKLLRRYQNILGILLYFNFFATNLFAQEILAPFLIFGYSPDDLYSKDKNFDLNSVHESLVKNINPDFQKIKSTLLTSFPSINLTLNKSHYLNRSFWYYKEKTENINNISSATPMQHQWIICKGMGVNTVFLESSTLDQQEILALNHLVLPELNVDRKKKHQADLNILLAQNQNKLTGLYRTNLQQMEGNKLEKSSLKLDSQFSKTNNPQNEMDERCLQLLAIESMVTKHRVLSFLSREGREFLNQIAKGFLENPPPSSAPILKGSFNSPFGKLNPPLRSNTRVLVDWQSQDNKNEYKLNIRITESVFGQLSTDPNVLSFKFLLENKVVENMALEKWKIESTTSLENLLIPRINSLDNSVKPKIAKIRGAWVYLDKGRAWGLRINDRLLVENIKTSNGNSNSEGHVVGFFGPELNIKDASGQKIAEGAIVYIRKGQRNVQIGNSILYDSKVFPISR